MAKWGEINCPRCEELEAKLEKQDDLVQAAVAAALTGADEAIQSVAGNCTTEDGHVAILAAVEKVRSLITADAQAALDRVVWAERERGFWAGRSCGGSKAEIDAALNALCQGGE